MVIFFKTNTRKNKKIRLVFSREYTLRQATPKALLTSSPNFRKASWYGGDDALSLGAPRQSPGVSGSAPSLLVILKEKKRFYFYVYYACIKT